MPWAQFKVGVFLDDDFVRECEALKADAEQYLQGLEEKKLAFRD